MAGNGSVEPLLDVRRGPALERVPVRGLGDPCGARHEAADVPAGTATATRAGLQGHAPAPAQRPRPLSLRQSDLSPRPPRNRYPGGLIHCRPCAWALSI